MMTLMLVKQSWFFYRQKMLNAHPYVRGNVKKKGNVGLAPTKNVCSPDGPALAAVRDYSSYLPCSRQPHQQPLPKLSKMPFL